MKYIVDFTRFNEHLVDIHLNFKARVGAPTLWLPTWIAGSYLIREFSKTSRSYSTIMMIHNSMPLSAQRILMNSPTLRQAMSSMCVMKCIVTICRCAQHSWIIRACLGTLVRCSSFQQDKRAMARTSRCMCQMLFMHSIPTRHSPAA